jgi:hypothetical protein
VVLAMLGAFCGTYVGIAIGVKAGRHDEAARWERWTYAHVAFETKGDRK